MIRRMMPLLAAAALPALAHAQSSVTLYGLVDAGVAHEKKSSGSVNQLTNLSYPSRLGFRGVEDLGGGLAATFQLEGDLQVDTGGAGATAGGLDFQRVSVVGMRGHWGEVQLGRNYTPGFLTAVNHDNLAYGYYNSLLVFTAGAGGITTRYSNGIFYVSPLWSGFSFRAAYALGERATAPRSIGDNYAIGGTYARGPVTLDAYYQVDRVGVPAATPTAARDRVQAGAGGQWRTSVATFFAGYGQAATDTLNNKTKVTNLGVTVPFGPSELLLHVMRLNTQASAGLAPAATTWGVTYRYNLSKRTALYATAGQTRNNRTGTYPLFSTRLTAAGGPGDRPEGFGVGITHKF